MKKTCSYFGEELPFRKEFTDAELDDAQSMLDSYKAEGLLACCLHENGKHQLYAQVVEVNGRIEYEKCKKCGSEKVVLSREIKEKGRFNVKTTISCEDCGEERNEYTTEK